MLVERLRKLSLPPGGNETTLAPSSVSFAAAARQYIDSITPTSYFGPNQPMRPMAPAGTLPRAFDYNFGVNMMMQPRTEEPGLASFGQLRAMADNCDVLREVIEHRKKQIVKVQWMIRPKSDPTTFLTARADRGGNAKPDTIKNVRMLTNFFERPDRQRCWTTWLSMFMEEVFVIDALSIWPMYDGTGKVAGLNLVDGSTIKPLHDTQGWTPNPPNPGYQQFIKGMPSVNMTAGFCEQCLQFRTKGLNPPNHLDGTGPCSPLVYMPRNPRTNKFYGFSNVEWVIRTIMLAMNRQMSQISYYTEGNVPEMIVQAPASWTKQQIEEFQIYLDTKAGDIAARRRMWFVPETKGINHTKDAMLTDEMDEWIARVFCFAMGVSPQPFIRSINRATAQVASESAAEEGTIPELEYIKSVINYIIRYFFFIEDVEFVWKSDVESDSLKQMRVDTGYSKVGMLGIDEGRVDLGLHPIGIGNIIMTKDGAVPLTKEYLDLQMKVLAAQVNGGNNDGDEAEGTDESGKETTTDKAGSGGRTSARGLGQAKQSANGGPQRVQGRKG